MMNAYLNDEGFADDLVREIKRRITERDSC
jgi:hypothetical protein